MAVITLFFSLFIFTTQAHANELVKAWKAQNYRKVSDLYRDNQNKDYSRRELILISYSLRKLGFFRQDIKLNIRMVRKNFSRYHKNLIRSIQRGDSIDPDDYPKSLMVHYWNLFTSYGEIIKGYSNNSSLIEKDYKHFKFYSKLLSELEFREGKVDKYNDAIIAHRQHLSDKIYHFKTSWNVQYVSWQQEATLQHTTAGDIGLVLTNKGICAGGDLGMENYLFHFYLDGCVLMGSGGVKNNDQNVIQEYRQSDIPAYGIKAGPGFSVIVSPSRSRIGFKIPVIYSLQKLQSPKDPDYSIQEESPISFVTSLYSRWQFGQYYFQTEFGKYISKEQTFWGLGIGREF